ncbi:M-phase phosphoprotein 9 isoform X2 [Nelusetta ayraudi]|uniref:M-phase phosphoprotein 9 isoform X2 n=1 Tax=Nelusetta ayraudi TaxID=303726 RepID=UPI003F7214A4
MSTDDSISEDVSSSGALSHCHASGDGDGGKGSETSLLSSEATSASGLAVSEDRHTASHTTGGTVERRPAGIAPACNNIRSLCLSTDEAFGQGKSLPFINPSSLETLRALMQEIQSSGETDPEIWKNCEGRWLHLFQLVEKQYQEQILAQQEQYQCQIQLIQDEIKALVQLQNRQASIQLNTELSPTPVSKMTTNTKDYIYPPLSGDLVLPKNAPGDNINLETPARAILNSPRTPHSSEAAHRAEERGTTVLSSGYGTLSAWDTGLEPAQSPGDDQCEKRQRGKTCSLSNGRKDTETLVTGNRQQPNREETLKSKTANQLVHQQRAAGSSNVLTSWAQRQKLRTKKTKTGRNSSQTPEYLEKPCGFRESPKRSPPQGPDSQEQARVAVPSSSSFTLRRSDSLTSEASGLTYWRLNENEMYRPLPDSFDSGAYLLLQEASMSLSPSQEPQLSLKEIYKSKQRPDSKRSDYEGSVTSSSLSPQLLTLDPSANRRHSDRTSGFTSPSHFSSPSFCAQPQLSPRLDTPVSPDSMVEGSPHPADADFPSDASSISAAAPCPTEAAVAWGSARKAPRAGPPHDGLQRLGAAAYPASEEEGSRTHTSTLRPRPASGAALQDAAATAGCQSEGASHLEDPVVVSLLRQNLREKHSRHVADLRAYYECEIQTLRDKLNLRDLPQEVEKANQALTKRCKQLDKALAEATFRIQELEGINGSLEEKLAEWPERYAVAAATVKSLQQRLEDGKRSEKEKDASLARLTSRMRQLEESMQRGCMEADEKEARRERESKMLQDLFKEYDSLGNEHERLKSNFMSTEDKLLNANDQISELKRVISKLESQVKQLEHENQARARYTTHSNTQPSGAGLFYHPDLLLSPSKGSKGEPDITRRKSPGLPADQTKFQSAAGHSVDPPPATWRCTSPSECDQGRLQEQGVGQREASWRAQEVALTPVMRALIELEETRATESRAPSKRDILPVPLSARSSPKRCPSENYSTAFGVPMPREEHLLRRFNGHIDQRRHSFHSGSPRKRLQFVSADKEDELQQPESSSGVKPPDVISQQCWGQRGPGGADEGPDRLDGPPPAVPLDGLHSLAEAEKLFDELTQEKLQIEADLSRIPRAGGKANLQTRLDEVAWERRLERVNSELGSIRMILKRFHVLRSSANI